MSSGRRRTKLLLACVALALTASVPDPEAGESDLDLLITAWQRRAARSSAAENVDADRLRAAMFDATGDGYKHYDFPETPEVDITDETLWSRYLDFQSARQRKEFASAALAEDRPRSVLQLDAAALEAAIAERVRRIVAVVHRRRSAPAGELATVWLLSNGHPSEHAREASVRAFTAGFPGVARFVTVDVRRDPELAPLVGRRLTSACVLGNRLVKDVTRIEQWIELLVSPAQVPRPPQRSADLPLFDAHEHLREGGEPRLLEIFEQQRVRRVVIAALPSKPSYRGFHDANLRVLALAKRHPELVLPFVILPPATPGLVEALEAYVADGARGVKLMTGHGSYFDAGGGVELDDPEMMKLFRYCEARGIPVLWHVNAHLYGRGFLRVLDTFPKLRVVVPHLGGYLSFAPEAVRGLLERYPNLALDLSFGTQPMYLRRALEDLSLKRDAWRRVILDHPDRFLFGVDLVVSADTSLAHTAMLYRLYRGLLEDDSFDLAYFSWSGFSRLVDDSHYHAGMRGLALPDAVLRQVYWGNAARIYGADG